MEMYDGVGKQGVLIEREKVGRTYREQVLEVKVRPGDSARSGS